MEAIARGSQDNVSALVVSLNDEKMHDIPLTDSKLKKKREKLAAISSGHSKEKIKPGDEDFLYFG